MARRKVGHSELARRLSVESETVTASSVAGKLMRGTFTAEFLLKVLCALDCTGPELGTLFELIRADLQPPRGG